MITTFKQSEKNIFFDYTMSFDPISNCRGLVHFTDHKTNESQTVGFTVNDEDFQNRVKEYSPLVIADLIDLSAAIYASDRLAKHEPHKKQRRLNVILPVRNPKLLNSSSFQSKLNHLLIWTTGSQWVFHFKKRETDGRCVENQQLLFPKNMTNSEVALWSGGLDALAGLYTRLTMKPEQTFILFGTGSNNMIHSRQGTVAEKIQSIFPNHVSLLRVPIHFNKSGKQLKNKLSRARGVVFTLLGSACAYLMGQKMLFVYENGIGAINLPYTRATIGLDHSRSVHPKTLFMVSDLVSELLGEQFTVKNPFLFWTKAEMCKSLARDKRNHLSCFTTSCDHRHRKKEAFQCGYCSSCLLRRQALAAVNLEDNTRYVITHGKPPRQDPSLYLRHMKEQVDTFNAIFSMSSDTNLQWKYLSKEFSELDDVVDYTCEVEGLSPNTIQNRLIRLYQTYVSEWEKVDARLSTGLIDQQKLNVKQASEQCLTVTPQN
ncbi:7-cyano-7-deazaguanine synthase [Spirulina sp. CS-785/01]|uniref:7-cyano-7-deazaguanine synthase n=1 Tax=Spirulina sp. CS-785/01 TaxID=3021716 RepID=UPI00232B4278|nr:7-cyano-7-deazaguanine synthase [Spirulina sp. CS-785/01]MDB9313123.1 7-cyano-7-deazaguanine synthase [Spirulina sp. CS-785/01]